MLGNIVIVFLAFWFVMLLISFEAEKTFGIIVSNFFAMLFAIMISAGFLYMQFPGISTTFQEAVLSRVFLIVTFYHIVMSIYGFINNRNESELYPWR